MTELQKVLLEKAFKEKEDTQDITLSVVSMIDRTNVLIEAMMKKLEEKEGRKVVPYPMPG